MNKLEENNIKAQVELMSDIISNFKSISYAVTEQADKIVKHLATKQISQDGKTITLDKAEFDNIMDIARLLQNQRNWHKLNAVTQNSVPENEIKLKVLSTLQAH